MVNQVLGEAGTSILRRCRGLLLSVKPSIWGRGFQKALNRLNSLMPLFALFVKLHNNIRP